MKILSTSIAIAFSMVTTSAFAIVIGGFPGAGVVRHQKAVATTQLRWETASAGQVPDNAVIAAKVANKNVLICHADHNKAVYPGEMTTTGCLITFSGVSVIKKQYAVLTGVAKLDWKSGNQVRAMQYYFPSVNFYGVNPAGSNDSYHQSLPVIGGFEVMNPAYPHPLYICRAMYEAGIRVGKVVMHHCNIAVNGKEIVMPMYQVLFMRMNS